MRQRRLGEPLDQRVTPSFACFTSTGDHRHILACGYWDSSFKCFSTDTGLVQVFVTRDHSDAAAVRPNGTVCVWTSEHCYMHCLLTTDRFAW